MEHRLNKFDDYVSKGILANNDFGIRAVLNLESIRSLYFDREKYNAIEQLIKNRDIEAIRSFIDNDKTTEFLEIMQFVDQDHNSYIVTVYDSLELWQDPQVIDIFLLK